MNLSTPLREMAASLVETLPSSLRAKALGPQWGWTRQDSRNHIHPDTNQEIRFFIGMANFSGQGDVWARSLRTSGITEAYSGQPRLHGTHLVFDADLTVEDNVWRRSRKWGNTQRRILSEEYTHVVSESGRPILGAYSQGNPRAQAETLLNAGTALAFLWHGHDIRVPHVHAEMVKDSPFRSDLDGETARLEKYTQANEKMADDLGVLEFVSTPDLLVYRPNALWLPTLVNQNIWVPVSKPNINDRRRPRLIHIPSRSAMKGSALIRPLLERLDEGGIIEYVELSGILPADMPDVVRSADMLVDQFGMDAYGTAAIEAMSQGVPVIGQIGPRTRKTILEQTGREVPIADASKDTLVDVVTELASSPASRLELATAGLEYIEAVHTPAQTGTILCDSFLNNLN